MTGLAEVEEGLRRLLDKRVPYGLAFSGGCDSSLLLALLARGGFDVVPYTVRTAFQAPFELADALDAAAFAGMRPHVIEADILADKDVCVNAPDRCYRCKRLMFGLIADAMRRDGRPPAPTAGAPTDKPVQPALATTEKPAPCVAAAGASAPGVPVLRSAASTPVAARPAFLLDGTNASDDPARRPGMRALAELGVVSPLRELGLVKADVRSLSRELGLFTANKPNFSCYATKVPAGTPIMARELERVAQRDIPGWR